MNTLRAGSNLADTMGPELTAYQYSTGISDPGSEDLQIPPGYTPILLPWEGVVLIRGEASSEIATDIQRPNLPDILLDAYEYGVSGYRRVEDLYPAALEVLSRQVGMSDELAYDMTMRILNRRKSCDISYTAFRAILYRMFWNCYDFSPIPSVTVCMPETCELKGFGINQTAEQLRQEIPPILVETFVPICGNFGSSSGHKRSTIAFTLLRKRQGNTAPGRYSFPGGHLDSLTDLASWREYHEEVRQLTCQLDSNHRLTGHTGSCVRNIKLLAIADQLLITEDGVPVRYLNHVWAYWLVFPYAGGGDACYVGTVDEVFSYILGVGDEDGGWEPWMLIKDGEYIGPTGSDMPMSPIARIVLDKIRMEFSRS